MQEFKIEISAEEDARRSTMLDDYQACLDAQWAAESALEQRCESFLEPLMADATAIRRRVLDVQLVVQHEMLLTPDTSTEEAKARFYSSPACMGKLTVIPTHPLRLHDEGHVLIQLL